VSRTHAIYAFTSRVAQAADEEQCMERWKDRWREVMMGLQARYMPTLSDVHMYMQMYVMQRTNA